ncbi:MAG TPA: VCBS repeat-containing protein, partial [Acidimicrobiia bacterium]|nr:VCBS repeat-containing protein [Acidimicrobiia bacterium]
TVIVGAGSSWVANQSGGVVAFNADGTLRWRMQTDDIMTAPSMRPVPDGYSEGVFSTPAVGDVDGDGHPDIVVGAWDNKIYALNRDGSKLAGFPFWQDDSVWSSPALYDVNGDGRMDIFVGGDSTAGGSVPWSGGVFWALTYSNGGIHELWPHKQVDEVVDGSPAIADLNGSGRMAAVVNTGSFYNTAASKQVFAWHLDDGSPVAGWPVTTGGVNSGGVATGDLDGDGRPEVVVTSRDGNVYAFHGNGSLMWMVAPQAAGEGGGEVSGAPIIADLNGDGRQDVAVGNGWATFTLNGHDGSRLFAPLDAGWSFQNAPAIGDFGAGGWRLVISGMHPNGGGVVSSFSIAAPGTTSDWPQWRKNALHLGAPVSGGNPIAPNLCSRPSNPVSIPSDASARGYWELGIDGNVYSNGVPDYGSTAGLGIHALMANIVPTGTANGYWVLGRDGGVFSFGDAAFLGSMGGKRLNAAVISMAPTPSGNGYWLLAADGGVFSFGDAQFWGSTGALRLNAPIIAMAPTRTGKGYWLLALDGGIFSFGDAAFHGSTGAMKLNAPVISLATAPSGNGYWLLGADGGVFSFGVPFYGSVPGTGMCNPPRGTQIRP